MQPPKKTALNKVHHDLKARMMDFAGWELPAWYTSILEEHKAVRTAAGIFDVSDMGRVWVTGRRAGAFLDRVLTRPAQRLETGSSHLSLMCLEDGGILDDLWLFRMNTDRYLIVWNAAYTERKLDWLHHWSDGGAGIDIEDASADTAMVAVQGPAVADLKVLEGARNLPRFVHTASKIAGLDVLVARTGYTGEDGFEVMSSAADAVLLWQAFMEQGAKPCGLGARDSLRLEAGMLLCGQDMDADTNPFEAGLGWLVDFDREDFVGKKSLLEIKRQGVKRKLIGFKMDGREIARAGYPIVRSGREVGRVTSGGYAPTLGVNIGLGYVPAGLSTVGTVIEIMIRSKPVKAQVVDKRFYRQGGQDESQGV